MKKLISAMTIIASGLISGSALSSAAVVTSPEALKTQVSQKSSIVLAANGRRERRREDGTIYNCAK